MSNNIKVYDNANNIKVHGDANNIKVYGDAKYVDMKDQNHLLWIKEVVTPDDKAIALTTMKMAIELKTVKKTYYKARKYYIEGILPDTVPPNSKVIYWAPRAANHPFIDRIDAYRGSSNKGSVYAKNRIFKFSINYPAKYVAGKDGSFSFKAISPEVYLMLDDSKIIFRIVLDELKELNFNKINLILLCSLVTFIFFFCNPKIIKLVRGVGNGQDVSHIALN